MIRFQTKLAVGKHCRERLHTVIRQFTVSPVIAVALVIIWWWEGGCKCSLDYQDWSLDYSDMCKFARAG